MGLLWRTEGTSRIVETLNIAFGPGNNVGLNFIRKNAGFTILKKIEKKNWAPGHLARMLELLPYDQSGAGGSIQVSDRKRWHYFLKTVVGNKGGGDNSAYKTVFLPLQDALADAILTKDDQGKYLVSKVAFDHVELPNPDPKNPPPPRIVIYDMPSADGKIRSITLYTAAIDSSQQGDEFDQPDGDEQGFPGAGTNWPPWKTS